LRFRIAQKLQQSAPMPIHPRADLFDGVNNGKLVDTANSVSRAN
jgi:hypothetical protein